MAEPYDVLERELVRAGRSLLVTPVPDDLPEQVLSAISARPLHRPWTRWLRAHRRRVIAAAVAALIVALFLTPPVRAAVVEWLRIGGVVIRTEPPIGSASAVPVPVPGQAYTLEQARALVDFPLGVPAALGAPERVSVSEDRRVVGMDWVVDGDPIHLDQFDGTMSWAFVKRNAGSFMFTRVAGRDAVWIPSIHQLVYVDRTGIERTETARISGPCLVWEPTLDGRRTTARLEGFASLEQALSVAESLR